MLRIEYLDGSYKPARLQVRLMYLSRPAESAVEITDIRLDPRGILRLEKDTRQSTAKTVVYYVHPDHDLLADNKKFWEAVGSLKRPIKLTIWAKPARGYAKPRQPTILGHTEIEARPPAPELHWYDMRSRPPARDPSCIHLRADGEDHFELRVECKLWLPQSRRFEYDEKAVEFSHYLPPGTQLYPDVFGPSPYSRPWIVARPGSENNREYSSWESKAALPMQEHPDLTLPVRDTMRVRAWPRDSIIFRDVNIARPKPGIEQLAEAHVAVQLDPEPIKAEIIEPKESIPADGKVHIIELEIRKRSDGSLLKRGELSFKLRTTGNPPGGTITPESVVVKETDNGRVRLEYTPRELYYRPGRSFEQSLDLATGTGEKAVYADTVKVDVNPALKAKIGAEKCGLNWPQPFELNVPAGETPSAIDAHIGMNFREELSQQFCCHSVGDARPAITVIDDSGEHPVKIEGRTARAPEDIAGRFYWFLPELEKALSSLPEDRRTRRLREFEGSALALFDTESRAILAGYTWVINNEPGRTLFLPGVVDSRWLLKPVKWRLVRRGAEMARDHAERDETECQKVRNGTALATAALQGTIAVDNLHRELLNEAINLLGKFFWDVVNILIEYYSFGATIFEKLPHVPGWLASGISRYITAIEMNPLLGPYVGPALTALKAVAHSLAGGATTIGPMLKAYWDSFLLSCCTTVQGWVFTATSALARQAGKEAAAELIETVATGLAEILADSIVGKISATSGPDGLADRLRRTVGETVGLGIDATEALDSVTNDVSGLRFSPTDWESCDLAVSTYLQGVTNLDEERKKLLQNFSAQDEQLEFVSNAFKVLFVFAGLCAVVGSGGTATPWLAATFGAGTTPAIATMMSVGPAGVVVSCLGHSRQAWNLFWLVWALDDKYLRLTRELTQ